MMRRQVGSNDEAAGKPSGNADNVRMMEAHQRKIEQLCMRRPSAERPRVMRQVPNLAEGRQREITEIFLAQKLQSVLSNDQGIQWPSTMPERPKTTRDREIFDFVVPNSRGVRRFPPPDPVKSKPIFLQPITYQPRKKAPIRVVAEPSKAYPSKARPVQKVVQRPQNVIQANPQKISTKAQSFQIRAPAHRTPNRRNVETPPEFDQELYEHARKVLGEFKEIQAMNKPPSRPVTRQAAAKTTQTVTPKTPPITSKPALSVPKSTKNILNKSERALFEKNINAVLSEFPSDLRINRSLPGSNTRVPSRQNIRSAPTSAHKLSPRSEIPRRREFSRPQRDVVVNKTDSTIQIFDNSMINENSQNESSNFDDSDFLGIFNSLQQTDDKQRTRDPSFEMSLPQQLQKTTPNRTLEESLPANLMQMLQDIQKRTHDLINGYNENESMPPATLVELDRLNKEMDHVIALLDSPISTVEDPPDQARHMQSATKTNSESGETPEIHERLPAESPIISQYQPAPLINVSFPVTPAPQNLTENLNIQEDSAIVNIFNELLNPVRIVEIPIKIPVNAVTPTISTEYLVRRRHDREPNMLSIIFNFDRDVLHNRKLVKQFVVENVLV